MGRCEVGNWTSSKLDDRTWTTNATEDYSGRYAHAHVGGVSGVSEQADGNKIHARFRISTHIFKTNAARTLERECFDPGLGADARPARRTSSGGHVIEQNGFRSVRERLIQFFESAHFNFDGLGAASVADGVLEGGHNAAGQGDVIVLDEDAIGKIEAMVLSPTAAHRVFIDDTEAGGGFASVEDACLGARHRFDELSRKGGNPAHSLQEIQNDALAGKKDARIVPDDRDRLALVQPHTIKNFGMRGDLVVRSDRAIKDSVDVEDARDHADASEDAILFGKDGRGGALARVDAGVAGGVARGAVFKERVFQDRGNASAVKVHRASGSCSVSASGAGAVQLGQLMAYLFAQGDQFLFATAQSIDHLFRGFRQELFVAELPLIVRELFFELLQFFG